MKAPVHDLTEVEKKGTILSEVALKPLESITDMDEEEQLKLALKLSKEDYEAINCEFDDKEALIVDEVDESFKGTVQITALLT